ncbi:purpurin-like isoform X2 [Liolophura sinensis]|uniref:purpurin-like isoform X2 n=1 Tax=Liolophura sinensis TaxID=3198878 RepID=UPI0031588F21
MAVLLIRVIFIVSLTRFTYAQSCLVKDAQVKGDLDLERMEGRWFELKWRSYSFVPEEFRFRDYEHRYKYAKNTGNMIVTGQGRPTPQAECFTYSGFLDSTSTPGKLVYTRPNSVFNDDGTVSSDYWIVDTDYVNYALSYGCREILTNGTCHPEKVESWLWGRNPSLPDHLTYHVENLMKELCLDPDSYMDTPHGHGYVLLMMLLGLWVAI